LLKHLLLALLQHQQLALLQHLQLALKFLSKRRQQLQPLLSSQQPQLFSLMQLHPYLLKQF